MRPPMDSLLHQSRKLAEVMANTNFEERRVPPPPYSTTVQYPSNLEDTASETDYLDDSNEDEDDSPQESGGLNIHIDASISIIGTGNAIIMSPASAISDSNAARSTNPAAAMQAIQKRRQTRLTDMATAIISAFSQTSALHQTESKQPPSIEVKINTGIKVEGSKNVIYAGTPPRVIGKKTLARTNGGQQDISRKRRAQSEPLGLSPASKRVCFP